MEKLSFEHIKKWFWSVWDGVLNRVDDESSRTGLNKEKVVVFVVALILALCLWLLVNLSRDFNLNVNLPITLGNIPEDKALSEELPEFVTVSVQGEGWKLINVYNNPPKIFVDVTREEVNILDQVQQQMNAIPDISVQKVQPLEVNVELEDRVSKKVPVISKARLDFAQQYGMIGVPELVPDSITVSGATSLIDQIDEWETDSVVFRNIRDDVSAEIKLKEPERLLTLSTPTVQLNADVAEFTEGEARVFVRSRNLPGGTDITFSPTSIRVRYRVPIEEYAQVRDLSPFSAYVPYEAVQADSTGFVTPRVALATDRFHIKIEDHEPGKVAYFMVVGE